MINFWKKYILEQQNWANGENQCDGSSQSPIDLITQDVFYNNTLKLDLINYDQPLISYKVTNNGHSSKKNLTKTKFDHEFYRIKCFFSLPLPSNK